MRGALGQVGFQLQDVIVQMQMGTDPLKVFVQQGSQIAGAFGPVGAIIGTVGSVVAIAAGAFLGFGREAAAATEATNSFKDAQESARDVINESAKSVEDLRQHYDGLSESMREVARLDLTASLRKNAEALEAQKGALDSILAGAGGNAGTLTTQAGQVFGNETIFGQGGTALPAGVAQTIQLRGQIQAQLEALRKGAPIEDVVAELARISQQTGEAVPELQRTIESLTAIAKSANELGTTRERLMAEIAVLQGRTPPPGVLPPTTPPAGGGSGRSAAGGSRSSAATLADQARREAEAREKARQEAEARLQAMRIQIAEADAAATGKAFAASYNQSLQDEQEANAQVQADLLAEPAKQAIRAIQQEFTSVFQDLYAGQLKDASDYWQSFQDLATGTLANISATLATSPLNNLLNGTGKIGSATLGGSLTSLFGGTGAAGLTFGDVATAGSLGALGGGFISTATGGNPLGGTIGGGVGAAGGFILGNMLFPGVGGIPGAALGSLAGSLIGGLFGGGSGGGEHNDNFQYNIDLATGRTSGQNTKPSQENASIVQQLTGRVQSLVDALQEMGGTTAGSINIQSGNNSGLTLDGVKYGNAEDLQLAAFRQIVLATSGLDPRVATAAKNSKATDAQEFVSDLQFAQNFERLTGSVGDVTAATQELIKSFEEARKRADELGLSTAELATAQRDQLEQRAQDIQGSYRSQVESAFGYVDSLTSFRDQLRLPPGPPRTQLGTARSQFEEIAAAAQAGDLDAINQLQGAATAYLGAGQSVYASGAGYQEIQRVVEGVLNAVIGQGRDSERELLAGIADDQNTVADLTARLAKVQDDVLAALKAINTNLQRVLSA